MALGLVELVAIGVVAVIALLAVITLGWKKDE